MSIVREMRERQVTTTASGGSGLGGTLLIGFAAFAIGALAIGGWKMWSGGPVAVAAVGGPANASPQAAAQPALTFTGKRLGEAENAPLLKTCVKLDKGDGMDPQTYYKMMNFVGIASAIGSVINPKEFKNNGETGIFWNTVAECMFQQNSWALCDPDNRQLAVTSASASIRNGGRLAAALSGTPEGKSREGLHILSLNARARDQVLDGLRSRVRNGYLIADDFGPLPPPEIKAILANTKTIANGCTKQ